MEVSSSNTPTVGLPEGKSPMKKATEVQSQQVMKVLEGMDQQTKQIQQMNAQKTGMGKNLNLVG